MAFKRFKTDKRIWLCISLLLFAIPWFIQEPLGKTNLMPVVIFFKDPDGAGVGWRLLFIFVWTFFCGIPATLIGWVAQAILVFVRDRRKVG
jgi:hypothetical protein